MDRKTAKAIRNLVVNYQKLQDAESLICGSLAPKPLENFHQWVDSKGFEGGFLVKNQNGQKMWMLLIEWNESHGFYLVLFPEDKSGPVAEIHKVVNEDDRQLLKWRYSPSKRDGKNEERKRYFKKYFYSREVHISIPSEINDVGGFLNDLSSLYETRVKADKLDSNKPGFREGFPEGKLKEKLHKQRERNPFLINAVKQETLES